MSEELNVIREVTNQLEKLGIEYMITGSIAANYYTTPRMTRDIDIVIELSQTDISQVVNAFSSKFYISKDAVSQAVRNLSMFNIIHNDYAIKVDFICRKNTDYRKKEFLRKTKINLGEFSIWIVSAEDLILSKLDWAKDSHSEKQLGDVTNLIKDAPNLDLEYLKKWANNLGVNSLLEEVAS